MAGALTKEEVASLYRRHIIYEMPISLLLRDGTEIFCGTMSGGYLKGNRWIESRDLPVPVDLTQVKSLRVGDTEFPLQ